jgi:hypothetical protein
VQYHEANIANGINGTSEFQNNFFILLNMAIGGNWPGFTIDNNAFPASMYVDYVRVYQSTSAPTGVATVYQHCNYGGYAVGLPVGSYTLSQLQARGVVNDDVSSLRVQTGYQIRVYQGDNFTGSSLLKSGDDACLVDDGFNDKITSVVVSQATSSFSQTIQAESYNGMLGVQVEATTDAGGGSNVGWIDTGDWMAYNNINVPATGSYLLEYRVASPTGGRLPHDLNAGAVVLGSVNIPATGGWQSWQTVSQTVTINAGTYNFGIFAQTGGWNINWWRMTRLNASSASIAALTSSSPAVEMEVYPNPTYSTLEVRGTPGGAYRITNGNGVHVLRGETTDGPIDVSNLPRGIYTISVEGYGERVVKRFVKK